MKRLFLLLSSLIYCLSGFSQHGVVANVKENVVYIGLPNPINFAVEGRYCKDLILATENGKLTPDEENSCGYTYYPDKPGKTELLIRERKAGGKVLGKVQFRAKYLPDPVAMVSGKSGGEIRRAVLLAQIGIVAVMNGFDFDARFMVLQYTVTTYRKNEVLFTQTVSGPRFTEEVTNAFKALHSNDRVMFSEMSYRAPDGHKGQLLPIEFRIIE